MPNSLPGPRHSLSKRLLWITVLVVLALECLTFLPALARERHFWLDQRVREAELAALSADTSSQSPASAQLRLEMLRLAGTKAIRLQRRDRDTVLGDLSVSGPPTRHINISKEPGWLGIVRAIRSVVWPNEGFLEVTAQSTVDPDAVLTMIVRRAELVHHLRTYTAETLLYSIVEAIVAGLLVYAALFVFFVRPMRQIVGSIHRFRNDPERTPPISIANGGPRRNDEIAYAAIELAAMQSELRAALWRNARLAAIGTAVAKVSHDLRGVLSPAMLAAERLQMSKDPATSRAGEILVRAVERAVELVRGPLEFAREGPIAPARQACVLHDAIDEAADQVRALHRASGISVTCDATIVVDADPRHLERIFGNLLRNAAEANAQTISVTAAIEGREATVRVADDAGGLPPEVRQKVFQPFVSGPSRGSTGLGLAIVRDLVRAHGGDIVVEETGPEGTTFRFTLPVASRERRPSAALQRSERPPQLA